MILIKCKHEGCKCFYTLDESQLNYDFRNSDPEKRIRKCPGCNTAHAFTGETKIGTILSPENEFEFYHLPDGADISEII